MPSLVCRILLALAAVLATACTTAPIRLQGENASGADAALIILPEQLEVSTINGLEIAGASGLFGKGDKTLEIAPGRYEVLAFYRELWIRGDQQDMLRSDPALFVVDASPGHRYRLEYPRPDSFAEAEALAGNFGGWVEDVATGERTPSQDSGLQFRRGLVPAMTFDSTLVPAAAASQGGQAVPPMPLTGESAGSPSLPSVAAPQQHDAASAAAPATVAAGGEAPGSGAPSEAEWLALMKGWWSQATPEERREFLHWISEPR